MYISFFILILLFLLCFVYRKTCRLPIYTDKLIFIILFIKFALRLPYRQTIGLAKKLFEGLGIKLPDFRTLHYRYKTMKIDLSNFPSPEDLLDDFVIVLDSTGIKVSNRVYVLEYL